MPFWRACKGWSKAAFIITNRYEEVAERKMDELDRGVRDIAQVAAVH